MWYCANLSIWVLRQTVLIYGYHRDKLNLSVYITEVEFVWSFIRLIILGASELAIIIGCLYYGLSGTMIRSLLYEGITIGLTVDANNISYKVAPDCEIINYFFALQNSKLFRILQWLSMAISTQTLWSISDPVNCHVTVFKTRLARRVGL